jgi:hypothetical protein
MILSISKIAVAMAVCSLFVRLPLQAGPNAIVPAEYVIKAAYLYNFAMFVEWPADAFSRQDSPIVIGIAGTDRFGAALEEIVRNKKVNNRRLVVKRLQSHLDLTSCHIVFFHSGEGGKIADIVQQLRAAPVLLVGETSDFAKRGGMINFTVEDNKVRCEINVAAARRGRLTISSKLLSLAKVIGGQ